MDAWNMDNKLWKRLLWMLPVWLHKLLRALTRHVLVEHKRYTRGEYSGIAGYSWVTLEEWEKRKAERIPDTWEASQ